MDFGRLLTAMVTPFNETLDIDFEKVDQLVDHLIDQGNDGIVVSGTTGESPTLTVDEKIALFKAVVQRVNGRVKVIAGTGSNNTRESIVLTKEAEKCGVDGIMLVVPYYNKPSQEGMYNHFSLIAKSTRLPVMLYNVPGRTSCNLNADTVIRLAEIENIVCIKEASGNLAQVTNIIAGTPDSFLVYSGDDGNTLPILSIGGHGIVSVAAHLIGNDMKKMIEEFLAGNVKEAALLHQKLMPIFEGIFITSNPVPIKAALKMKYFDVGRVRAPLTEAKANEIEYLRNILSLE